MTEYTPPTSQPENGLASATRNKLIIYIGILALANYLITEMYRGGKRIEHLDGSVATGNEVQRATLMTLFITIPVTGFILGALVALFPYHRWTYSQKYLGASLWCILVIQGTLLTLSLVSLTFF